MVFWWWWWGGGSGGGGGPHIAQVRRASEASAIIVCLFVNLGGGVQVEMKVLMVYHPTPPETQELEMVQKHEKD